MTRKIFRSIFAVAGTVLLISIFVIFGCLYQYFGSIQERQLGDELLLAAEGVERNGLAYLEGLEAERYRLTWVAPDGAVIYDAWADENGMENHADRQEIREALENREGTSSRYSTTLLEQTLYHARRLEDGSVLRISESRATVWILALGMFQPIAAVLVGAMIFSGVLAGRLSKRIVGPLNQLDLEHPLENDTYEELSPLLSRMERQHRQIDAQVWELKRRQDEFSQITHSMTEGLVLLNEKRLILNMNPAAMSLFSTDPGCQGKDFLTVERSTEISRAIDTAIREGHSELLLTRGGREYQLDMSRIQSEESVIGVVILSFDVTERAFAERNRREFTANVSHELKTPLQSIMGSAELLESGLVKPGDTSRFVGHIRAEAGRLVTLIDDIIHLSRLDEGGELPYEDVDLLDIVKEVTEALQGAAAAKHVTVTVTGQATPLRSVRRILSEAVYNLCDNAVKYNMDGGRVDVTVVPAGQGGVLTVKDTGIGIPPEHQDRIFERFYRVDKSHSKESGGTGLGLSIVKHAVQSLGGQIELQSKLGEGTTITIRF